MAKKNSNRVLGISEALSIKYNNKVYELRGSGNDVIVLSLGEAFFDIPLLSMSELPRPDIFHYTHSRGLPELRAKIANYYYDEYAVKSDPSSEMIVTAGSKIAVYMALSSVIDSGDEVLVYEPAWVSYTEQIKLCDGIPVQIPCYVGYEDFERFITPRTRMIILNNPNNPRGSMMSDAEIKYIHCLAKKYNLYILADEAYSEFGSRAEFISFGRDDPLKEHTIICNSISKNFGISGWRIGYIISSSGLISQILKINQHLITCAPSILEMYIAKYFSTILEITRPQIAKLMIIRSELSSYISQIGLTRMAGDSTFYFFVSIKPSKLDSGEFCMRLLDESLVSAVPGIGYGLSCDEYIRVSFGSEPINRVKLALDKIKLLIDLTS
jgi:aminotransferase